MQALIFDCDGVLVDTERDGHRVAFNRAFAAAGIDAEWDVDLYGELLKIAGGEHKSKEIEYRLKGKLSTRVGLLRTIPFDETGTVPLAELLNKKVKGG